MDSDGQHPPEMIPALVQKWREGADIVQTVRRATEGETLFKRVTSSAFYGILNRLSDLELPEGAADFRLLDRQVVDALNQLPERNRFLRGLVYWVGFRLVTVEYEAERRMSGVTKYNARKMMSFALNGITAFSSKPLRLSLFLGLGILAAAACYAVYILGCYLADIPLVPGWTSLLLATLLLSGIQLLMLGVVSEYLGRLLTEAKGRPIYIRRRPRRVESPKS
jgi:dolichol-phosphate mannosyltransferase